MSGRIPAMLLLLAMPLLGLACTRAAEPQPEHSPPRCNVADEQEVLEDPDELLVASRRARRNDPRRAIDLTCAAAAAGADPADVEHHLAAADEALVALFHRRMGEFVDRYDAGDTLGAFAVLEHVRLQVDDWDDGLGKVVAERTRHVKKTAMRTGVSLRREEPLVGPPPPVERPFWKPRPSEVHHRPQRSCDDPMLHLQFALGGVLETVQYLGSVPAVRAGAATLLAAITSLGLLLGRLRGGR